MPSWEHEILVELFRNRPELAVELLRRCADLDLGGVSVESGSVDLSQVVPTTYLTDAVTIVKDAGGEAVAAVIVEVQRAVDPDKHRTWPLYVAALRARLALPTTLLVLAPDPAVAAWARRAIDLGHPGYVLRPIVIGFADVPRITDPSETTMPELAVLSTLAHPEAAVAIAAHALIRGLPTDLELLYSDVLFGTVPALEDTMEGLKFEGRLMRAMRELREAREANVRERARGREEGREEGRDRLYDTVLALVRARLHLEPSDHSLDSRIRAASDPSALILALGIAEDERQILAALDRFAPSPS